MSTTKDWMKEDNLTIFAENREKTDRLKKHVEAMQEAFVPKVHHLWCNFQSSRKPETCDQCKRLYAEYPMGNMSGDQMKDKYFPDAIKRT